MLTRKLSPLSSHLGRRLTLPRRVAAGGGGGGGGPAIIPAGILSGLTNYYKLDGNSNDSIAALSGTDTAMAYAAGKIGNAGSFNGSTSNINLDAGILATNEYSIAAWVYPDTSTDNMVIFARNSNSSVANIFSLFRAGGILYVINSCRAANLDNPYLGNNGSIPIPLNQWSFVACNLSSSVGNVRTYLNGVYDGGTPTPYAGVTQFPSSGPVYVGVEADGASQPFHGLIDELGFWNRALSDAEILTLYNAGAGMTTP